MPCLLEFRKLNKLYLSDLPAFMVPSDQSYSVRVSNLANRNKEKQLIAWRFKRLNNS